jgi:signal transduction histidine kinase
MSESVSIREAARFALVRAAVRDDEALERAYVSALRLSAETLEVARVGIWHFEDEGARIRCSMVFDRASGNAGPGEVIDLTRTPLYAEALHSRRAVVADDARTDRRTSELLSYLEPHGITSLLDCPVFEQGEVVGVVCYEHIGPVRNWTDHDKHFAATVSDMLGLYLEQRSSQRNYRALLEARRELERRHVMESLGRMATAIAHDFNNVLLAVQLRTDLMRSEQARGEDLHKGVEEVAGIIAQGSRLARKLLDLARQEQTPASVIDLADVLRSLRPTLTMVARGDVELAMTLPSTPVRVRLERTGAEQVVMNLAQNARDAMLGGGKLHIELSTEGSLARLHVTDTGVGMDEATREQIFEPFFTTKPKGEGDGLATVYYVITAANGSVEVTSGIGEGTQFRIAFPLEG